MTYLPNILSILRIFLAPLVCIGIVKEKTIFTIGLIGLAALTDFLDGYLARRLECVSSLGAILDPLADKVFILSVFFTLFYKGRIPFWFFLVIVLRDIMLLIGGWLYLVLDIQGSMSPSLISKVNTGFLFLLFPCLLLHLPYSFILMGMITLTTFLSGGEYAKRAIQIYRTS